MSKALFLKHIKPVNLVGLVVAGLLLMPTSNSFAASLNSAYAYVEWNAGIQHDLSDASATGPASANTHPAGTPTFNAAKGSADFGVLKAQVSEWTFNSGDNVFWRAGSASNFSATVQAAPPPLGGGAGLNFGDSVSLNLSFRLKGDVASGSRDWGSYGTASYGAELTIIDPFIELDCASPDGCYTPKLVDFRAGAWADSMNLGNVEDTYHDEFWDLKTRNALGEITSSQRYDDDGFGSSVYVNTGVLSTTIDTTIGSVLDIAVALDLAGYGWGASSSGGDFSNTFGIVLTSITDGVALDYGGITPPVYSFGELSAVPIPAAVWLFGSGLLGLFAMARRRRRV